MRKQISLLVILFFSFQLHVLAQNNLNKRLFVLNEGTFGRKGSLGSIDFVANTYQHIDSVAAYGNQLLFADYHLYVVDGDGNVKIYGNGLGVVLTDSIMGISARGIARYQNQLLVACSQPPYFRAYEITTWNLIYSLDNTKVRSSREEIEVLNNKAYLSGFLGDSVVEVVDLVNHSFVKDIQTAPNPYQIEQVNGKMYVASLDYSNPDFTTNTLLQEIDPTTDAVTNSLFLSHIDGFTASQNQIFMKKSNGKLVTYTPANQVVDTLSLSGNFYGLFYDRQINYLFYTSTDFVSNGSVGYIYNNSISNAVNTDISPRCVAYEENNVLSLENESVSDFSFYPNPATNYIWIENLSNAATASVSILSCEGKEVLKTELGGGSQLISLENLAKGMYFVHFKGDGKERIEKLMIK